MFLLLSIEITEIPSYISYLKPSVLTANKDLFWLRSFHLKMAEYYYYKFTCDRLSKIFLMIAFTKTAVQYSTTVFLACFLILCYVIFDLGMFWLNYNIWVYSYEFVILFIYWTARGLVRPFKPDTFARIRSIF